MRVRGRPLYAPEQPRAHPLGASRHRPEDPLSSDQGTTWSSRGRAAARWALVQHVTSTAMSREGDHGRTSSPRISSRVGTVQLRALVQPMERIASSSPRVIAAHASTRPGSLLRGAVDVYRSPLDALRRRRSMQGPHCVCRCVLPLARALSRRFLTTGIHGSRRVDALLSLCLGLGRIWARLSG